MAKKSKNKPFDGVSLTIWDRSCRYAKVEIRVDGESLKIKLTDTNIKRKSDRYRKYKYARFEVPNFRKYTARELLDNMNSFSVNEYGISGDGWGAGPVKEGIFELYKALDLRFGYVVSMLRDL